MRRILVVVALVATLAACGGSSGGGGGGVATGPAADPVAAVNNVINAYKAKALDKLGPLTCAAKRAQIAGGLSSNTPPELIDAMTFDFQDLKVEQTSINGDNAKVHVTGKLALTLDAGKAKPAVRKMLEAQAPAGTTVTDAQVDSMLAIFGSGKPNDISTDVDVVKENGGWLVCSQLGTTS